MNPLAVYIHIPFCTVKCGYCDFNAYAGMDGLKPAYRDAIIAEIGKWKPYLTDRVIGSIAFGGGTPGEMPAADIAKIVGAVQAAAPVAEDAEISLEANPGTTTPAHFAGLRAAGVTRLSLGAQSFHAGELRFLDRIHSPEAIEAAFRMARTAGFESVSLDLIYGIPGQSLARWQESIDRALALRPGHLSLYALTVEPGTPLASAAGRGEVVPADPDLVADMYEAASDWLATAGFEQYEISNWALPGHRSRHNQVYWTDGDYLGIGAGAHGYIGGERYENIAHPRRYIDAVADSTGRLPIAERYRPEGAMARSDWLTARLRSLDGFDPAEFAARFGETLEAAAGPPLSACAHAGLLTVEPCVKLTERGRLLHGEISVRVLAHLETTYRDSAG
jgi:oxygen-independent coproporphyrinogen-3 oxidase